MAGGVEELMQMLYEMVGDAFSLPFGADRCVLNRDKLLGLLDEISALLPTDMKQARTIVDNRNEIIATAKKEAEAITRQAEERARQMVSEQEILISARKKAAEILATAEQKSKEVRRTAGEYVDNTLKLAEEALSGALSEVKGSRSEFSTAMGARVRTPVGTGG